METTQFDKKKVFYDPPTKQHHLETQSHHSFENKLLGVPDVPITIYV